MCQVTVSRNAVSFVHDCVSVLRRSKALRMLQLSTSQAQEAEASVRLLRLTGPPIINSMQIDAERAMLACDSLPAPVDSKDSSPRKYRVPQFLSLSRLSLTKKTEN